jgi:hypothetical protein
MEAEISILHQTSEGCQNARMIDCEARDGEDEDHESVFCTTIRHGEGLDALEVGT